MNRLTEIDKREQSLDNVAGLMIIYMILGHIGLPYIKGCMIVLFFFMPWFFFKAGMFHRQKKIRETISGGVKRLVIPFLVYSFVGHIIACIGFLFHGDFNPIHYFLTPIKEILLSGALTSSMAFWFLLSLFFVRLIYTFVSKYLTPIVILIVTALFACLLHAYKFCPIVYIANVTTGCFFYTLGAQLKDRQYGKCFFICSIVFYLGIALNGFVFVNMLANDTLVGEYALWFPASLSGIILINNLFRKVDMSWTKLYIIGQNSMVFYIWHWVVILVWQTALQILGVSVEGSFYYLFAAEIIFLPIIYRVPFLTKYC
ncbi:MAG: acyltransferase family protein [Bacteroidales bacterium]|nr:acyltransferase family protein [Bacteroidales bacterium]MCM1147035.1 acyltransferase family protein [Bacteroidales bacterium]MCM1205832.1 acyltransferase family protein [Bacillota bacterium]MCM1509926.1 acyltransferase family protein [Clostridium sp.]